MSNDYILLLEIGQSNATPQGQIQQWEDLHPYHAIRSANTQVSQIPQHQQGAYSDMFTMPAPFLGGPPLDENGVTLSGQWQNVNLQGVALEGVRIATFYNPSGAMSTYDVFASDYPGTWRVMGSPLYARPTGTRFHTNHVVQLAQLQATITDVTGNVCTSTSHGFGDNDLIAFSASIVGLDDDDVFIVSNSAANDFEITRWPSGEAVNIASTGAISVLATRSNNTAANTLKLTRRMTDTEHTVAFVKPGSTNAHICVVDPPFTPAPIEGEQFDMPLQLNIAASNASDPLVFSTRFGGLSSHGTLMTSTTFDVRAAVADFVGITTREFPLRVDEPFAVTWSPPDIDATNNEIFVDVASTSPASDVLQTTGGENLSTTIPIGTPLLVSVSGVAPLPTSAEITLVDGVTVLYVAEVPLGGGALYVSATRGGPAINWNNNVSSFAMVLTVQTWSKVLWPVRKPEPVFVPDVPAALLTIVPGVVLILDLLDQNMLDGEPVIITGSDLPTLAGAPVFTSGETYYAKLVTISGYSGAFQLEATVGGGALTWDAATGEMGIERVDAYNTAFMSETRGGAEITDSDVGFLQSGHTYTTLTETTRWGASLSGLQLRCTKGDNINEFRNIVNVAYDTATDTSSIEFESGWSNTPAAGDVFIIEPTKVGNLERPFRKFCQLLPWSPFEGKAKGSGAGGPSAVTFGGSAGNEINCEGLSARPGTPVRFYTTGELPHGLIPGKRYFIHTNAAAANFIKETYNGDVMLWPGATAGGSGTHTWEIDEQTDRGNPFPPGFNYPNHFSIPAHYQAFHGPSLRQWDWISSGMQLALDIQQHTGKRVLYVNVAFGGTSIGRKEVIAGTTSSDGFGWHDPRQMLSWSASDANGCYQRLLDTLDGVGLALTEEGSTVSDAVVHFLQGEEDGSHLHLANQYGGNLDNFKANVRGALQSRGLTGTSANKIRFLQPKILERTKRWPYASTVNAAIEAAADADPWSRWIEVEDLAVKSEGELLISTDTAHYDGTSMNTIALRAFAAWLDMERSGATDVEICNLALANIGESQKITSIDPVDGSAEAALCAQFYNLTRDVLLERHPWDFTTRTLLGVARAASPRVDWKYAYDYPANATSILGTIASDVNYDYKTMGTTALQPYTVVLDKDGKRVLLTDQKNALLVFTVEVVDPTMWSALFRKCFGWALAAEIAGPTLKGEEGMKMASLAEAMAEKAFKKATSHDSEKKHRVERTDHVPVWQRHRRNPRA